MNTTQVNAFEYVAMLVSIILGLGITYILSALSDLLYNYKKVKFYWPHVLWIVFVFFLLIQDWFITFLLKDKKVWLLPEVVFVLLYPVTLFVIAKMLLPANQAEEHRDMKVFYRNQFPVIFFIVAISIAISIIFNVCLLHEGWRAQALLGVFFVTMLYTSLTKTENETLHKAIALLITIAAIVSVFLLRNVWVIK